MNINITGNILHIMFIIDAQYQSSGTLQGMLGSVFGDSE